MIPRLEPAERAWHTKKVRAGKRLRLGETQYGDLFLITMQYTEDGKATFTLEIEGLADVTPPTLAIENNGVGSQVFKGQLEYLVAVREADFEVTRPWAAFTVIRL